MRFCKYTDEISVHRCHVFIPYISLGINNYIPGVLYFFPCDPNDHGYIFDVLYNTLLLDGLCEGTMQLPSHIDDDEIRLLHSTLPYIISKGRAASTTGKYAAGWHGWV